MLRHPLLRLRSRDAAFLKDNLATMLQDPLVTASSLALVTRIYEKTMSRKAVGHYSRSILLLKKSLQSKASGSSDAVLLSLIHLMAVEVWRPVLDGMLLD